jgi:putative transposase
MAETQLVLPISRDECLNANWFSSLACARDALRAWRKDYNTERPHSSPEDLAPSEYISNLIEGNA